GNTYVLDNAFGRVYKVDTTGKVTLFAGNGTVGFSGEGAVATTAAMNGPSGMCIDAANNVYVADSDNAIIREIVVTASPGKTAGHIYTFAGQFETNFVYGGDGGPATSAHLHFPDGCSFDSHGNMYIADRGNNAIRVVIAGPTVVNPVGLTGTLTAGNIYLFAGALGAVPPAPPTGGFSINGTAALGAKLYGPFDVFVDSHDNVFYADLGNNFPPVNTLPPNNNIVREIPATAQTIPFAMTAGAVYTVAGVQGSNGHTTSTSTTAVAATAALLNQPRGISVDAAGNLFFADNSNQVIREVPIATANGMTAGAIYDVAGAFGSRGFAGEGVAADTASLNFPAGTYIDTTGNLLIADQTNDRVREVVPSAGPVYSTGTITTFAGNGSTSYSIAAPPTAGQMNVVFGVAIDSKTADLAIADVGILSDDQSLIRLIAPPIATGSLNTVLGVVGNNNFSNTAPILINNPLNFTFDSAGNLYIADTGNCIVRKYTGTAITTIAGVEPSTPDPSHPEITTPQCGFTASGGVATATKIGFATDTTVSPTAILGTSGVAVDSHGNVFFSDAVNNIVYEVPAATSADGSKVAGHAYIYAGTQSLTGAYGGDGGAAIAAQLSRPQGLYIDIYDNLYIADSKNNVIREVPAINVTTPVAMTAGNIYTVAGNQAAGAGYSGDGHVATSGQLNNPFMIAVDHALNIFIADSDNSVVREVAGATVTTPVARTRGNIYTVAGNNTAGFTGDGGAATSAELNSPKGLAIDATGNLLIGDSENLRVRSVAAIANVAGVPLASLSPNPLVFTAESVGTASAASVITLTNTGSATLNVTGAITFTGGNAGDFTENDNCVTPGTVLASGTCTINVIFTPQTGPLGARSATLSVPTNAFGSPQTVVLNGTAGSPTADLNPTSLTFASTVVGKTSAAQAITLTNNGNVATLVTGVTITGANATDFATTNTCGVAGGIQPKMNCMVSVTFTPTAAGARTATLNIADNAGTQTVALTGTGGAATLTLTVKDTDPSSTQTVAAGATATYNLSVTANNATTVTITCTGAPTAAVCTPAPASVVLTAGTAGTFKVGVTTTARGSIVPFHQPNTKIQPPSAMQLVPMASLALLFAIVMMFSWMQNPASRMRTLRVAMSVCLILMPIAAATMLVGCGGSSSTTPPPPATGTPAGSYTLTVTATSGSTTASTTVTLVVN
ncbi:MAG: choice-of-anchor D domain-containing protein, partial [Candidatus Acidiferrum sp.]